jgi:hypothetical protein
MCVTLYLVLQKYIRVNDERLENWFDSYIDMLHRFKLWSPATAIINACKVPRIQERNQVKRIGECVGMVSSPPYLVLDGHDNQYRM